MERSKYNVGNDIEKRSCNGIVFDSRMEMRYYRDVILPGVESGQIKSFELQKPYELQPKFSHDGTNVRAITYVADFYIEYMDGRVEVIDTKGAADSAAKMKRKMMWYIYPDLNYKWITYVKKLGGWIDYNEAVEARRESKKLKKKQDAEENKDEQDKESYV